MSNPECESCGGCGIDDREEWCSACDVGREMERATAVAEDLTVPNNISTAAEIAGNKILQEQIDLNYTRIIQGAGWVMTCQTPGCVWMWKKKIGQNVYIVFRETALRFEESGQLQDLEKA